MLVYNFVMLSGYLKESEIDNRQHQQWRCRARTARWLLVSCFVRCYFEVTQVH